MNKYIFPIYNYDTVENYIGSVMAKSLKDAFAKLSDEYELSIVCETQLEFEDYMYKKDYLIVGEVIDIDEIK